MLARGAGFDPLGLGSGLLEAGDVTDEQVGIEGSGVLLQHVELLLVTLQLHHYPNYENGKRRIVVERR